MSKSTKKKEGPIMPERVFGRLTDQDLRRFEPGYAVKRWAFTIAVVLVIVGAILWKALQ